MITVLTILRAWFNCHDGAMFNNSAGCSCEGSFEWLPCINCSLEDCTTGDKTLQDIVLDYTTICGYDSFKGGDCTCHIEEGRLLPCGLLDYCGDCVPCKDE